MTMPTFKTKSSLLQDNPLHATPSHKLLMEQTAVDVFNQLTNYQLLGKKMFSGAQRET